MALPKANGLTVRLLVAALVGGALGAGFTYAVTHFVLKYW
jgi:hypothetical protein